MADKTGPLQVEVDGISLAVAVDLADDYEITEQMVAAADPHATLVEKNAATVRLYRAILGDDYGRVKDELRARNGGSLPNGVMVDFMSKVISSVGQLKNS